MCSGDAAFCQMTSATCYFYFRVITSYGLLRTRSPSVMELYRSGLASAAGHRQRSSESDSAARWRGVAAVRRQWTADTGSLLVQERPRAAACRTRPAIRSAQLRHAPDFR